MISTMKTELSTGYLPNPKGIYAKINEGLYSDTLLIFNNMEHKIHIKYLIEKSKYFNGIYSSNMVKNNKINIELDIFGKLMDNNIFTDILLCMYNDEIIINDNNKTNIIYLINFYILWDYLGISVDNKNELECKEFIRNIIKDIILYNDELQILNNVTYNDVDLQSTFKFSKSKQVIIFTCNNTGNVKFSHNKDTLTYYYDMKTFKKINKLNVYHNKIIKNDFIKDCWVRMVHDNIFGDNDTEYYNKIGEIFYDIKNKELNIQCMCKIHTFSRVEKYLLENNNIYNISLNFDQTQWLLELFNNTNDNNLLDNIINYYDVKFEEICKFDKQYWKQLCFKYSQIEEENVILD